MPGDAPSLVLILRRRGAAASIAGGLARPEDLPSTVLGWRQERLRGGHEMQVPAEVDEQQAVAVLLEEAEDQGLGSEHGAVHPSLALGAEGRLLAPQAEEIPVQRVA